MRRLNIFLVLAFLFTSCVVDDMQYIENGPIDIDGGIKIFGAVQDFDVKKVTTRASDTPSDSFISEMTMFVFDAKDKLIQGYNNRTVNSVDDDGLPESVTFAEGDKCSSAVNIQKANPTFLIDTKEGLIASLDDASPRVIYYDNLTSNDNDLSACKIYIVANAYHQLEGELGNITTLDKLEALILDINEADALAMPKNDDDSYRGFPMIGTHYGYTDGSSTTTTDTFNLSKSGNNAGAVAKIPLKKLYSKVAFTIQVNANEVVSTPKFKIEKAEVFNVPKNAHMGRKLSDNKPVYESDNTDDYISEMVGVNASYTPADWYYYTESPYTITSFSRTEIKHTDQKVLSTGSEYLIEFDFYLPEHKVTPNTITYPTGISDDFKQYYKPKGVGAVRNEDGTTTPDKIATFVRIHGVYTDHNGQIKNVRYDIYLGQNNTDDFTVKRNQLLTNTLVITGLTNYHDAYGDDQTNTSVDHRVDVDYKGFNLSMERTAILDSHFEVRPLDIELSPGSTMTVTIPEDCRSWVAMESDAAAFANYSSGLYCSNEERRAVRKYFTTDLVSSLTTANSGSLRISNTENEAKIYRIWFYIDENPNVYDKSGATTPNGGTGGYTVSTTLYRNCPVKFSYTGTDLDSTDGTATVSKTETINFQQWNLWRVWNSGKTRYYDIEHEEEYLNNYASDQQYGGTQDGMPWGLEGLQLSRKDQSIFLTTGNSSAQNIINNIVVPKLGVYYDFYINSHDQDVSDEAVKYEYAGREFCEKIIAMDNVPIGKLTLVQSPQSAVEYCYHKNKRDGEGNVVMGSDTGWYLPSVDEIEEITIGAYDEFDQVFQDKLYWSSQPAYIKNLAHYYVSGWSAIGGALAGSVDQDGDYYIDDIYRARATKVVYNSKDAKFDPAPSGIDGYYQVAEINAPIDALWNDVTPTMHNVGTTGVSYTYTLLVSTKTKSVTEVLSREEHPGNKSRTDKCRIRAVYRSGVADTSSAAE